MELALDVYHLPASLILEVVSILVFVELALDEGPRRGIKHGRWGFNPCFRGTCS